MDKSVLKKMKLFLFDMDGTLYLGSRLYDFTIELLQTIRETGGKYLFITNNSSKSVADYVKKLEKMGISATREDFMTSSQATAYYLHKHHEGQTLYVCGTESLKEELRSEGFTVTTDLSKVECVVMGFDTELTFKKLDDVSKLLTEKDIPYIATNPDYVCPTEYGYVPDCGSVADMLFNATGKRPLFIGKPEPAMPLYAVEKVRSERDALVNKDNTLVIGDRLYTDIACGINAGTKSMLVLSGETTQKMADESEFKPTIICKDCSVLLDELK
jgi:HAD superfamily hydrolase (TIGR01450 family)